MNTVARSAVQAWSDSESSTPKTKSSIKLGSRSCSCGSGSGPHHVKALLVLMRTAAHTHLSDRSLDIYHKPMLLDCQIDRGAVKTGNTEHVVRATGFPFPGGQARPASATDGELGLVP